GCHARRLHKPRHRRGERRQFLPLPSERRKPGKCRRLRSRGTRPSGLACDGSFTSRFGTPPPAPLPETERGKNLSFSPSPLRGGGQGGGVLRRLLQPLSLTVMITRPRA